MSLERKIQRTPWKKVKSFLVKAGIYSLTVPFLGSCVGPTLVERRALKPEWVSVRPVQQEVISSEVVSQDTVEHQLGEEVRVDYDQRLVEISLLEQTVRSSTKIDSIRESQLLQEIKKEELIWEGSDYMGFCNFAKWSVGVGVVGGGILGGIYYLYADEEDAATASAVIWLSSIGFGVMLAGLALKSLPTGACDNVRWTKVETTATNNQRSQERTYTKTTAQPPEILSTLPANATLTASGDLFPERTYRVINGRTVIEVQAPEYPVIFAGKREDIGRRVATKWINPQCQGGVIDYITSHAQPALTSLQVRTQAPAGREGVETDEKTYPINLFLGPSREEVIRYVVDEHINSRIQQATVVYSDMDSHFPVTNIQASFTPVGVPNPAGLVRGCFGQREDQQAAERYVKDYTYSSFETRINGEHSFMIYVPSTFRVKVVHPSYHYLDERLKFEEGNLVQERFLVELGSKHRVRAVPE